MDVDMSAREVGFGTPDSERKLGGAIAVGFFLVTAFIAFVADAVYHTNPELLLWLFVLVGVSLSALFAYWRSGVVVSLLLVFGPVLGPLAYYRWSMIRAGKGPIALFLSFDGYGAPSFWIPTAFVFGALAFCLGTIARSGVNYLVAQ
jgi:hypothetical protein